MEKFYITTPIYYVNDKPHIGHTYTTVLADVISRYQKLAGRDVFFLTGTDEHGQKILQAADKAGVSPQQHCDSFSMRFKEMWGKLNVNYTRFIRTTDPDHIEVVQKALQNLFDKGDIYKDKYEGWYCVPDERFWTEKDLDDGKCPDCGRPVIKIEEENYFFRMSKYQDWLIEHIKNNPEFIQPDFRANEVLGFLKRKLNDLCISRPKERLSWGVELPFDSDYVTYVWVDALINYITAAGVYSDDEKFKKWWPVDYHLIGKDILTTHAVYWPIILHALDIEPPRIFAHGWWLIDKQKMGKSLGNAIDPYVLVEHLGADRLRYYLIRDMVVGQDSSYSFSGLIARLNNDLANDLGNMLSRITNMVTAYFDGVLPEAADDIDRETLKFKKIMSDLHERVWQNILELKLHDALEDINSAIRAANRYIETTQPWQLAREGNTELLGTVLFNVTQLLAKAGILLNAVIPEKSMELLDAIGYTGEITLSAAAGEILVSPGTKIKKTPPLFPRLDRKELEKKLLMDVEAEETDVKDKPEGIITIEQLSQVKLVVGEIIKAEKAPDADKLILLDVDLGGKKRNLVAGLAQWYSPDELLGKKIIVVTNLKPAKIRGYESNGMLLAADDGKTVSILTVDKDVPAGSEIR